MQQLSIKEMRESVGQLDHLVNEAGEIIVTRHGKAIARILPIKDSRQRPSHAELRGSLPMSKVSSTELVRADRDER